MRHGPFTACCSAVVPWLEQMRAEAGQVRQVKRAIEHLRAVFDALAEVGPDARALALFPQVL